MIACAVRTPSWLWLTPIVHQNDTRLPLVDRRRRAARCCSRGRPVAATVALERERLRRDAANSSKPLVCASMNARSIQPRAISRLREAVEQRAGPTSARARRCCVAAIAVSVLRGSMTMISGCARLRQTRSHMIGCAMHRFDADEHEHVGLLEVGVGVRRRVEAERLLVGDDRGGHALARVAVAVHHAHAELGERAEQRQLLGRHLAGAEERDRLRAVRAPGSP